MLTLAKDARGLLDRRRRHRPSASWSIDNWRINLNRGQPFDAATGLQNNLNRWYDASVGRWLGQDPIGFDGGDDNLYRYCGNGPADGADPSGLQLEPLVADALKFALEMQHNDESHEVLERVGTRQARQRVEQDVMLDIAANTKEQATKTVVGAVLLDNNGDAHPAQVRAGLLKFDTDTLTKVIDEVRTKANAGELTVQLNGARTNLTWVNAVITGKIAYTANFEGTKVTDFTWVYTISVTFNFVYLPGNNRALAQQKTSTTKTWSVATGSWSAPQ